MAGLSSAASMVAVWEWLNEFGNWRPYEPHVCNYLEQNANQKGRVYMGNADPALTKYTVDLAQMHQIRHTTGTARMIQRKVYPASSPAGSGILWQWSGDIPGSWNSYNMEAAGLLEDAYNQGLSAVDLSRSPCQVPYTIDLRNMRQIRNETGFVRQVQRIQTTVCYPPANPNAVIPAVNSVQQGQSSLFNNSAASSSSSSSGANVGTNSTSNGSIFGGLNSNLNPASLGSSFSLFHGSQAHKSGSVIKKKIQYGHTYNGSPKMTRQRVQNIAAHHQHIPHLQQHQQQQQPQQQHQQPQQQQILQNPQNVPTQQSQHHTFQQQQQHLQQQLQQQQQQQQQQMQQQQMQLQQQQLQQLQQQQQHFNTNSFHNFPTSSHLSQMMGHFNQSYGYPSNSYSQVTPSSSQPQTVTTGRTMATMLSPAMTGMTSMLVSPAVPMVIQSPPSSSQPSASSSFSSVSNAPAGSKSGDSVVKKYGSLVQNPPKDEDCCICCEKLTDPSGYTSDDASVCKLRRCGHMYHWSCLQAMYDNGTKDGSLQCPTCKTIYGEKCGNCPAGQMQVTKMPQSLPGYSCPTLRVEYYISAGIQGPEHPNPGQQYSARGFPRYGYLPENDRGNKLVKLLMMAWERRLTFTIGTSVTTGEVGTVVWNEIHHKTEFGSNRSGHGYPDPNYMDNLTMELSLQGVTEDQLNT